MGALFLLKKFFKFFKIQIDNLIDWTFVKSKSTKQLKQTELELIFMSNFLYLLIIKIYF